MPKKYDLIWCGSLLTHVSEHKAVQFLDLFLDSLNEQGLLLVSFHGRLIPTLQYTTVTRYIDYESFRNIENQHNDVGFGFSEYPGTKEYGVSLTALDWTMKYVMKRHDVTLVYYSEKLFDGHQDMLAIKKTPVAEHHTSKITFQRPLEDFNFEKNDTPAKFYFDYVDMITNNAYNIFGWAFLEKMPSESTKTYLVLKSKNNQYVYQTAPLERTDVADVYGSLKRGQKRAPS